MRGTYWNDLKVIRIFKVPLKRVLFILKVRIAQLEMWLSTVESGQGRCADHVLLASVKY